MSTRHLYQLFSVVLLQFFFLAAIALILLKRRDIFILISLKKNTSRLTSPVIRIHLNILFIPSVIKDTTFFDARPENDWWINIDVPRFGGRIYISYKEIGKNNFDSLVNDGFKMAYKQHTDISTGINDSVMKTPNGAEGIYFSLSGNTATANQFFLTDSTKHFLRGALYFNASPNEDSLGIVNDFLKKDLHHLINTLKWR